MGDKLRQHWLSILMSLFALITSLVTYAYKSDQIAIKDAQAVIKQDLETEISARVKGDLQVRKDLSAEIKSEQLDRARDTEFIIKYMDTRFDDLKDYIKKNNN